MQTTIIDALTLAKLYALEMNQSYKNSCHESCVVGNFMFLLMDWPTSYFENIAYKLPIEAPISHVKIFPSRESPILPSAPIPPNSLIVAGPLSSNGKSWELGWPKAFHSSSFLKDW